MGFTLQDIISGALQDVQNGASAVGSAGNTLNQNLNFYARRNDPVISGVAAGVEAANPNAPSDVAQKGQDVLSSVNPMQGPPEVGAGIDLATLSRPAAIKASAVTKQAIQNVLKAHRDVTSAYHASPLADQAGAVDLSAPLQIPARAASTKATPLPAITNPKPFQNFDDVTTKVLNQLVGKTVIPKNELIGLMNKPGIKPVEQNLFKEAMGKYGNTIPVQDLADEIHSKLMPLTKGADRNEWSEYSMGERQNDPGDYAANVYQSPYEVSNGQNHFPDPNYFAHVRREDFDPQTKIPITHGRDANDQWYNRPEVPPEHQEAFDAAKANYSLVKSGTTNKGKVAYNIVKNGEIVSDPQPKKYAQGMIDNLAAHDVNSEGGTRNIQEIQSDLFQRGRYKDELQGSGGYNPQEDLEQGQNHIDYLNERIAANLRKMKEEPEEAVFYQRSVDSYKQDLANAQQKLLQLHGEIAKYGNAPNAGELIKLDRNIERTKMALARFEERNKQYPEGDYESEIADFQQKLKGLQDMLAKAQTPEHLAQQARKGQDIGSYKNEAWWQRIVRQEHQSAAREGKTALRFPTGDTAAKIEGYVDSDRMGASPDLDVGDTFEHPYEGGDYTVLEPGGTWHTAAPSEDVDSFDFHDFKDNEINSKLEDLTYNLEHNDLDEYDLESIKQHFTPEEWELLNTETNPDQLPLIGSEQVSGLKRKLDDALEQVAKDHVNEQYPSPRHVADYLSDVYPYATYDGDTIYTSQSSPVEVDTGLGPNDNIYDSLSEDHQRVHEFYDKDIRKYLEKLHGENLKEIEDDNGNTWLEVPLTKEHKGPVEAYMLAPGGAGLVAQHYQKQQQSQQ